MAVSLLDQTLRPLFDAHSEASEGVSQLSNLAMQHQEQTNWCWAAVAASVASYFAGGAAESQCSVANASLGLTGCCQDGASDACNQPFDLVVALQAVAHFSRVADRTASFAELSQEVDGGRPLCARVEWASQGGHFVCLSGYASAGQYALVLDPFYDSAWVPITQLDTAYLGSGRWTTSYWTQE